MDALEIKRTVDKALGTQHDTTVNISICSDKVRISFVYLTPTVHNGYTEFKANKFSHAYSLHGGLHPYLHTDIKAWKYGVLYGG